MISEVKIILSARKQPLLWQKRFFTNLRAKLLSSDNKFKTR